MAGGSAGPPEAPAQATLQPGLRTPPQVQPNAGGPKHGNRWTLEGIDNSNLGAPNSPK